SLHPRHALCATAAATAAIYTLSLHDALPISLVQHHVAEVVGAVQIVVVPLGPERRIGMAGGKIQACAQAATPSDPQHANRLAFMHQSAKRPKVHFVVVDDDNQLLPRIGVVAESFDALRQS